MVAPRILRSASMAKRAADDSPRHGRIELHGGTMSVLGPIYLLQRGILHKNCCEDDPIVGDMCWAS